MPDGSSSGGGICSGQVERVDDPVVAEERRRTDAVADRQLRDLPGPGPGLVQPAAQLDRVDQQDLLAGAAAWSAKSLARLRNMARRPFPRSGGIEGDAERVGARRRSAGRAVAQEDDRADAASSGKSAERSLGRDCRGRADRGRPPAVARGRRTRPARRGASSCVVVGRPVGSASARRVAAARSSTQSAPGGQAVEQDDTPVPARRLGRRGRRTRAAGRD